ncbi:Cysteine-rich receptor-like protein kinase 26 [Triticum urartu]|uniref:non-specific serine/threonine protein kinase n=1 Tax=Triticum urartu TaxID=4572 RepID=M7ZJV7_TRIUA|nr:Cysteine-rich receptor-like protein kinase 26 [Triticum urartu]
MTETPLRPITTSGIWIPMLAPTCSTMISSDEPRCQGLNQSRIQFPLSSGHISNSQDIGGKEGVGREEGTREVMVASVAVVESDYDDEDGDGGGGCFCMRPYEAELANKIFREYSREAELSNRIFCNWGLFHFAGFSKKKLQRKGKDKAERSKRLVICRINRFSHGLTPNLCIQVFTNQQDLLHCCQPLNQVEPKALPLSLLEDITNRFSEEREIGRGGFAVVYKGVLKNGAAIAVKRLSKTYMCEKEFHREVECLIKVNHKNVVRFIGYGVDSQGRAESYNGKFVMADVLQRLLCFEYLPHGTLDKYITDASTGLDWRKRYKIINGVCEGLHYLHQNRILHLDLKPQNILLDDNMLPKIADFGLARCFDEKQSRAFTTKIWGTMGYLAPESGSREVTYRFDLYSLGVIIIEILTGKRGYEAVEDILQSWSNRLDESQRDIQLEQVRVCSEIGIECIESNPAKRPVEADSDDPHRGALKESSEISPVSKLVDEVMSVAASATPSDQL